MTRHGGVGRIPVAVIVGSGAAPTGSDRATAPQVVAPLTKSTFRAVAVGPAGIHNESPWRAVPRS